MAKIRVLIVDDSVVIRRLVTDLLSADPILEVVGAAAHGRIALEKIPQANPDVITLDVEMPEMDGLQTLKAIRKSYPRLPVIMFSTVTERGAAVTLDALASGASDYVTKPSNVGSTTAAMARIREELIPRIKALAGRSDVVRPKLPNSIASAAKPHAKITPGARRDRPLEIVAIGVSTGGPTALAELLPAFPADFPVPIVIVQHMPPIFTRLLAERLNARCKIAVVESAGEEELEPGKAWIAPGNFHMVLEKSRSGSRIKLQQEPPENSCRPAVDVLFRSVAEVYGAGSLGVILTGMGHDGLRGCEVINDGGGQILAQDKATSVVWGMPGFVAEAGLADKILPLGQVAEEIVRRISVGRERLIT
jgi:two-component system, chemotaxis family, protein-glutamate methylesterase/glutaminase